LISAIVVVASDLSEHPTSSGELAAIETGSIGDGDAPEGKALALGRMSEASEQEAGRLAEQRLTTARMEIDELRKRSGEVERQQVEIAREREAADRLVMELRERLDRAWRDKTAAEQLAKEARRQLARARVRRLAPDNQKRLQLLGAQAAW